MKIITIDDLKKAAQFLSKIPFPSGTPSVPLLSFGLASEYLRIVVDNEWANQMVFGIHPTVSRKNREGRAFMRARQNNSSEITDEVERYRNLHRTLRIAESLFCLQDVEGIDARLEELRSGKVESIYSELEAGLFLRKRAIRFRFVVPTGVKGADYDAEILLEDGRKINCEMKCKAEGTSLREEAIRNPLRDARKQLPPGEPSLVFFKIPELWVSQPEAPQVIVTTIDAFLRSTSRVVGVYVHWEVQHPPLHGVTITTTMTRLERGSQMKAVSPAVENVLSALAGEPMENFNYVSFSDIAESVLVLPNAT